MLIGDLVTRLILYEKVCKIDVFYMCEVVYAKCFNINDMAFYEVFV